jgi:hypothetical protein
MTVTARRAFAAHVENNPDLCSPESPWAVVDDDSGNSLGCFADEAAANEKLGQVSGGGGDGQSANDFVGAEFVGLAIVEGHETADGRLFELDSVTWRDLPVPLMVNNETTSQHQGAWFGGRIEEIQRDPTEPSRIFIKGHFAGPRGSEAEAYARAGLKGLSVDVSGSDFVVEGFEPDEEGFPTRFLERYGDARIMAATITPMAAFEETQLWLPDEMDAPAVVSRVAGEDVEHGEEVPPLMALFASGAPSLAAIRTHSTGTSDASWDGPANEARLPSPMSRATAQNAYAWMSPDAPAGEVQKSDCKFIHHMVGANGQPGAANLTACSTGIGVLNGGRGGTTIPAADRQGVYNHLARHIRDGGLDVPEPNFELWNRLAAEERAAAEVALVAACSGCAPGYRPPASYFTDLDLGGPTAMTVEDSGEVWGHIGLWDSCHMGQAGRCVTPPHSVTGYAYFNTAEVICADGSRVATGRISMCTDPNAEGHLNDLYAPMPVALAHYDNTGLVVADVRGGEDRWGPWIHGALRYGLPEARVAAFRASVPSGDWRPIGINPQGELCHVLAVNSGGFVVPRARVSDGKVLALVASAAPRRHSEHDRLRALEAEVAALRRIVREDHLERLDVRARRRALTALDARVRASDR